MAAHFTPDASDAALQALCALYLRPGTLSGDPVNGVTIVFTPPLTVPEQATFADLQLMARFGVTMTLAEWQAIKSDVALLQAFGVGTVASKTLADVVNAIRAQSRILRVIVRA